MTRPELLNYTAKTNYWSMYLNIDLSAKLAYTFLLPKYMPTRHKYGLKEPELASKQPTIILIGGIYGAGKTTLAHELAKRLNIYQRAGVGLIIKTLAELCSIYKPSCKNWGQYENLSKTEATRQLIRESKLMGKVLTVIINRAILCGQNYIIDGVQILPQFLPLDKINLIVLKVSDKKEYRHRLTEPGRTRQKQSDGINFQKSIILEKEILRWAKNFNIPIFDNIENKRLVCKRIIRKLKLHPVH